MRASMSLGIGALTLAAIGLLSAQDSSPAKRSDTAREKVGTKAAAGGEQRRPSRASRRARGWCAGMSPRVCLDRCQSGSASTSRPPPQGPSAKVRRHRKSRPARCFG